MDDSVAYNRQAWDRQVAEGNPWTRPISHEVVEAARRGEWSVLLTSVKPVPRSWFPASLEGLDILGLASGGGQQAPIFAAAGARVVVLDNSPAQLVRDEEVARREGLNLRTHLGVMEDLSAFEDASFDLVFNPASTLFAPRVRPVWREVARVLRPGGVLMTGFLNPDVYVFDRFLAEREGKLEVRHALPYADERDLSPDELTAMRERGEPLEYSHTLEDLLAGQTDAGLHVVGFYEDRFGEGPTDPYMPGLFATRAVKTT